MDKVTYAEDDGGVLTFSVLLDDGVWCTVWVLSYHCQPPNPSSWDSPDDYYGYVDIEWSYDCPRELTDEEQSEIEQEAISLVEDAKQQYREESRINSWEIMKMQYE